MMVSDNRFTQTHTDTHQSHSEEIPSSSNIHTHTNTHTHSYPDVQPVAPQLNSVGSPEVTEGELSITQELFPGPAHLRTSHTS